MAYRRYGRARKRRSRYDTSLKGRNFALRKMGVFAPLTRMQRLKNFGRRHYKKILGGVALAALAGGSAYGIHRLRSLNRVHRGYNYVPVNAPMDIDVGMARYMAPVPRQVAHALPPLPVDAFDLAVPVQLESKRSGLIPYEVKDVLSDVGADIVSSMIPRPFRKLNRIPAAVRSASRRRKLTSDFESHYHQNRRRSEPRIYNPVGDGDFEELL